MAAINDIVLPEPTFTQTNKAFYAHPNPLDEVSYPTLSEPANRFDPRPAYHDREADESYKPNFQLKVRYDRTGNETRRWTLHGAWVKALEYDELEGGNTENTIEKLTICFQYWT